MKSETRLHKTLILTVIWPKKARPWEAASPASQTRAAQASAADSIR
jgi:hypothetical protein